MNYEDVMGRIRDLIKRSSTPLRPDSFGHDYKFPEDLTKNTSDEIGELMSKLAAYRGYTSRQCGIAEIQRDLYGDVLRIKMPEFISQITREKGMTKTDVKEAAKSVPNAAEIRGKISEADKIFKMYLMLTNIYTGQLEILSREISRRKERIL